jgi:hypothetical protein
VTEKEGKGWSGCVKRSWKGGRQWREKEGEEEEGWFLRNDEEKMVGWGNEPVCEFFFFQVCFLEGNLPIDCDTSFFPHYQK